MNVDILCGYLVCCAIEHVGRVELVEVVVSAEVVVDPVASETEPLERIDPVVVAEVAETVSGIAVVAVEIAAVAAEIAVFAVVD